MVSWRVQCKFVKQIKLDNMIHPVTRFPSYRFDIFKKNQYKITLSWVIRPSEDFPHFDEKTIIKKMYNIKCFQFTSAVVEDAKVIINIYKCVIKYQVKY